VNVTEILEAAATRARATYISAGMSAICRDYVAEALKHPGSMPENESSIIEDVAEFLVEQATEERGRRGGTQVRLEGQPDPALSTCAK